MIIHSCPFCSHIIDPGLSDGVHCPNCGRALRGLKEAKKTEGFKYYILAGVALLLILAAGSRSGKDALAMAGLIVGAVALYVWQFKPKKKGRILTQEARKTELPKHPKEDTRQTQETRKDEFPKQPMQDTKQIECAKCGSSDFNYDRHWKEYTCVKCGWIHNPSVSFSPKLKFKAK